MYLAIFILTALAVGLMFRPDPVPKNLTLIDRRSLATPPEPVEERKGLNWRKYLGFLPGRSVSFRNHPLKAKLDNAGLKLEPKEFLGLVILGGVGGTIIGWLIAWPVGILVGGAAGASVPFIYLNWRTAGRKKALTDQLPDALGMLSNSLRAGYSLLQAMEVASRDLPTPIGEEFAQVVRGSRLNLPLDTVLEEMLSRNQSPDLELLVTAILIQRQTGGNLAAIIDRLQETIRQRLRLQGEVKALTAQGRLSGIILALLPVGLSLIMNALSPAMLTPLLTTAPGHLMIGAAVILEAIGYFIITRMVQIEV